MKFLRLYLIRRPCSSYPCSAFFLIVRSIADRESCRRVTGEELERDTAICQVCHLFFGALCLFNLFFPSPCLCLAFFILLSHCQSAFIHPSLSVSLSLPLSLSPSLFLSLCHSFSTSISIFHVSNSPSQSVVFALPVYLHLSLTRYFLLCLRDSKRRMNGLN